MDIKKQSKKTRAIRLTDDMWDKVTELADKTSEKRGENITPSDVVRYAIEAVVPKELRKKS